MRLERGSWWGFLSRALVLGVVVFGAMRLAMARDGVAGGPSRSFLTVSGTLTGSGVPASPMATFRFSHATGGAATDAGMGDGVLCAPSVPITDRDTATGAFSVEVPLDQAGRECPSSLFDGSDAFVEVAIGSTVVVPRRPINPVPYARFADQAGVNNDCPAGYALDRSQSPGVICVRTVTLGAMSIRDEVVKVGGGGSAFWVDRYEAAVHHGGNGAQLGTTSVAGEAAGDIPSRLPRNGQRPAGSTEAPVIALSHEGMPSGNVTWFQANEACRAGGKRLLLADEWFAAASGTLDNSTCNTSASGPRASSRTGLCRSSAGVHDMIGNLWEWTAELYPGVGTGGASQGYPPLPGAGMGDTWSQRAAYNDDRSFNVTSATSTAGGGDGTPGMPAATQRGGAWAGGTVNGIWALNLNWAPSGWEPACGFRCVVPR